MKTPEEIKKGLECCTSKKVVCVECPYFEGMAGCKGTEKDALAYITQLEQRLAQAEEDIKHLLIISNNQRSCGYCKRYPSACDLCETDAEWRGIKEATT